MTERVLFVQGPPGSGKSTLVRRFLDEYSEGNPEEPKLRFLPVGKHVRDVLAGNAVSGSVSEIRDASDLVSTMQLPDHKLIYKIFKESIENHTEAGGVTLVDGFPREPEMIGLLQGSEAKGRIRVLGNIIIDVPDPVAIARQMQRVSIDGHPQYGPDIARKRVDEYRLVTEPTAEIVKKIWGGIRVDSSVGVGDSYERFSKGALFLMKSANE